MKHYEIKRTINGKYYIHNEVKFRTLNELIYHYSIHARGLYHKLTLPASKIGLPTNDGNLHIGDNKGIFINELERGEHIDNGHFGEVFKGIWRGIVNVAIKTTKPNVSRDEFLK